MKARKFRPCTVSATAGLLEPPLRAEATLDPNICPSLFLSYPGLGSSVGLEPQHSLPGAITSNDRVSSQPPLEFHCSAPQWGRRSPQNAREWSEYRVIDLN